MSFLRHFASFLVFFALIESSLSQASSSRQSPSPVDDSRVLVVALKGSLPNTFGIEFQNLLSHATSIPSESFFIRNVAYRGNVLGVEIVPTEIDSSTLSLLDNFVDHYQSCIESSLHTHIERGSVQPWYDATSDCRTVFPFPIDYISGPSVSPSSVSESWQEYVERSGANDSKMPLGLGSRYPPYSMDKILALTPDQIHNLTLLESSSSPFDPHPQYTHARSLRATSTACQTGAGFQLCAPLVTASGLTLNCLTETFCKLAGAATCDDLFNFVLTNGKCEAWANCSYFGEGDMPDCKPSSLPACTDGSLSSGGYQLCAAIPGTSYTCVNDSYCASLGYADCAAMVEAQYGDNTCHPHLNCALHDMDNSDCSTVPEEERSALLALYDALSGPEWTNQDYWASNYSVCRWHGVTCDTNRTTVTELRLQENNLMLSDETESTTDSASRRRLLDTQARKEGIRSGHGSLRQSRSRLYHTTPLNGLYQQFEEQEKTSAHYRTLSPSARRVYAIKTGYEHSAHVMAQRQKSMLLKAKMRKLLADADSDEFPSVVPLEFLQGMNNLTVLDLNYNDLIGSTLPEEISLLKNLQHLGLAETGLTGTLPTTLTSMTKLVALNIGYGIVFCDAVVACPSDATALSEKMVSPLLTLTGTYLGVRGNSVSGSLQALNGMPNLKRFISQYNLFEDLPDFSTLPSIGVFTVRGNLVTGEFDQIPLQSDTLFNIDLALNALSGGFPMDVCMSPKLRTLSFSDNPYLHWTIPECLNNTNLPHLSELYAGSCGLVGTLPDHIVDFPYLAGLNLQGNTLEGTLPEDWSQLGSMSQAQGLGLLILAFAKNTLSGTVPEGMQALSALRIFSLSSNFFTGEFPGWLDKLTALNYFYAGDNDFSGALPDLYPPNLSVFAAPNSGVNGTIPDSISQLKVATKITLQSNDFSGTIPDALCECTNLVDIGISYTSLEGSLPDCIGSLKNLQFLSLSHASLSGTLPGALGNLTSLKSLDLSYNSFTGSIPSTAKNMASLTILYLSNNKLDQSLSASLNNIRTLPDLRELDLSFNEITGQIEVMIFTALSPSVKYFQSLTTMSLSNNKLYGDLSSGMSNAASLKRVLLRNNQLTGAVLPGFSSFLEFDVRGNPMGCNYTDPGRAKYCTERPPSTIVVVDSYTQTDPTYLCPAFSSYSRPTEFRIDPMYYNMSLCKCAIGTYGDHGNCLPCPEGGYCPGGDDTRCSTPNGITELPYGQILDTTYVVQAPLAVEPGYYPSPDQTNFKAIVTCYPETMSSTMCNPEGKIDYECKEGYSERLCSKCTAGYYPKGRECSACPTHIYVVLFFAGIFFVIFLFYFYLVLKQKRFLRLDDAMKSFLFYTQTINLLISSGLTWPESITFFDRIYSYASFSTSIVACLNQERDLSARMDFILSLLSPVFALGLSVFFWLAGVLVMRMRGIMDRERYKVHSRKCMHSFLFMLNVLYLPIAVRVLTTFKCEYDEGQDKYYMEFSPWVECDPNGEWARMKTVSVIYIVCFVVAVPAGFGYVVHNNRKRLENPKVEAILSFLYESYKPDFYWFEVYTFFRRSLLAFSVTLLGSRSSITPFFLGFVLGISALFQSYYRPFKFFILNFLETLAFIAVGFTYMCGLIFSSATAETTSDNALSFIEGTVIAINVIVDIVFLVVSMRIMFFRGEIVFRRFDDSKLFEEVTSRRTSMDRSQERSPNRSRPLTRAHSTQNMANLQRLKSQDSYSYTHSGAATGTTTPRVEIWDAKGDMRFPFEGTEI